MPRSQSESLLRRNTIFRNYLAANTISQIGSSIFDIAIPLYVLERFHTVMALSMIMVSLYLPYFLMAPLTGFSADHFNKRKVMIFSDMGQVVCMLVLMAYASAMTLWPIMITVFVAKSLMLTFETVAAFQVIPGLVSSEDLPAANTWFLSLYRLVQILGPSLGGGLLSFFGVRSCILVNTISFGATLYFTFKLKNLDQLIEGDAKPTSPPKLTVANLAKSFSESILYVWRAPLFRPFVFLMFLWNLSPLALNSVSLTYYFTATHHYSAAEYGRVVSFFGIFGLVGFVCSTPIYRRYDFGKAFAGSCLAQVCLAAIAVLLSPFPLAMALLYSCSRTAGSVLTMGTYYIRQTKIPKHQIGGVNACLRMFFMSAAPVSALTQGFLINSFGVTVSFVFGVGCLWGAYRYSRKVARAYTSEAASGSEPRAA